jgi:hypothetical protein
VFSGDGGKARRLLARIGQLPNIIEARRHRVS